MNSEIKKNLTKNLATALLLISFSVVTSSCNSKYSFGLSLRKLNQYIVKGKIDGLEIDSVTITLVPESAEAKQQEIEIHAPGGYFNFQDRVKDGSKYYIHMNTNPQVNSCVLKNDNFLLAREGMNKIDIKCFSYAYNPREKIDTPPSGLPPPATEKKKKDDKDPNEGGP